MDIKKLIDIDKNFILASKSPRRKHLLNMLELDFEVVPSDIDENIDEQDPVVYAQILSEKKAFDIAQRNPDNIIIAADTIVVLGNQIINKPQNEEEAFQMLRKLSGNTHKVITGVSIAFSNGEDLYTYTDCEETDVTFRDLSDIEINAYIATGSPMDKAGAYGIQDDFGALFVSGINGCYYNIVGLPVQLLYIKLLEFKEKFL